MDSSLFVPSLPAISLSTYKVDLPAALVALLSVVVGFLMVVVFRYTSDQKAIHTAKDHLKAHLLAVRLFQDQLPVVLNSYGRIVRGTGRYLRLAFRPVLFVALPMTLLIVQLDRYLGSTGVTPGRPFLVKARTLDSEVLNAIELQLPPEIATTAPPVHIQADNEVVWRLVATRSGNYEIRVGPPDRTCSKSVSVSKGLERLSLARLRDHFWERMFVSSEPALPEASPIQSIKVGYPSRSIPFVGFEWNWIWLFFVLSLVAGFVFKSILGIEI